MSDTADIREKAGRLAEYIIDRVDGRFTDNTEHVANIISQALTAEREAGRAEERERCAALLEQGYPREVARRYRADGVASKNDMCGHGKYMWEDCESCAISAIRNPET